MALEGARNELAAVEKKSDAALETIAEDIQLRAGIAERDVNNRTAT